MANLSTLQRVMQALAQYEEADAWATWAAQRSRSSVHPDSSATKAQVHLLHALSLLEFLDPEDAATVLASSGPRVRQALIENAGRLRSS